MDYIGHYRWRKENLSALQRFIRSIRNFIGRLDGYGNCLICGDSWSWKEYHMLEFDHELGGGMFPYCEECNKSASAEIKTMAIDKLIARWACRDPLWRKANYAILRGKAMDVMRAEIGVRFARATASR